MAETHAIILTRRRRNGAHPAHPWVRAWRRLWGNAAVCKRCERSARDLIALGDERICVRCVRDEIHIEAPSQDRVADVGAVMALRALLKELEFCLSGAGRLSELLRAEAVLYTADVLLGWLTPQKLRGPHFIKLDELAVRAHLGRFDDAWGLRAGGASLTAHYDGWSKIQDNQQAYDKLEQTDRSYAQLLGERGR
jgi:hypothetical protein